MTDNINTLEQAKQYITANIRMGLPCPCCGQFVKLYKRTITSSMARGLVAMYQHPNKGHYIHVPDYFDTLDLPNAVRSTGDFAKLRYWGFIDQYVGFREDGSRRNGMYKITDLGCRFVKNEVGAPKYVELYNGQFHNFSGKIITIREALGKKFNYMELMNL